MEYKDNVTNHYEKDQLYPMQGYQGAAEWDVMDRAKYDLKLPGQLPHVRFNSHVGTEELMPMPDQHTMDHT
jgi:hypothetical protein